MRTIWETVCVLAVLAGLYGLAGAAFVRLLRPGVDRGTWVVLWADGAGEALEQRVRSLMWLQDRGLLRCSVLLVDAGLDPDGRAVAARLAGRWPVLTLCTRQELTQRIGAG